MSEDGLVVSSILDLAGPPRPPGQHTTPIKSADGLGARPGLSWSLADGPVLHLQTVHGEVRGIAGGEPATDAERRGRDEAVRL